MKNFLLKKLLAVAMSFLVLCTASAQIQPSALRQIQSLTEEKESRTPAQKKMDSHLIYAARMARGERITNEVSTLEEDLDKDANGRVLVDIQANISDALLRAITNIGGQIIYSSVPFKMVTARIPLQSAEQIASMLEVQTITSTVPPRHAGSPTTMTNRNVGETPLKRTIDPVTFSFRPGFAARAERIRTQLLRALEKQALTREKPLIGAVTSQGDATHRAAAARTTFSVDGAGIKIGILSDSYNNQGGAVANVTSGDLPGTTNPNGYTTPVTVLSDYPSGQSDEGRAMLQIVHDLAPGAQLYFATAFTSEAAFAQNILNLRTAGCDIICDDVFYYDEPVFYDGMVAQAVNTVTASGALYFSSAGNQGNKTDNTSSVWEGDFADGGTLPLLPGGNLHLFNAGASNNALLATSNRLYLYWSDPPGASSNDYDLYVLDNALTTVLASSTTIQNGSQNPIEFLNTSQTSGRRIVIFKKTSAAARALNLDVFGGGTSSPLTFSTQGQTHGHSSANAAFSCAATPAASSFCGGATYPPGPNPGPFNTANKVECFSSDGPRRKFYDAANAPITPGNLLFATNGGVLLQKPDITAADGVSTSGFSGGSGLNPFYGTSAAAPHAAAIAALVKQFAPGLTNAQIRTALTSTAIDIEVVGPDRNSGAGIVMAYEAIQFVGCTSASIITQPGNSIVCVGNTAIFTVGTGGSAPITYQWQESTNGGGTWNNITNGGVYGGATTATLTLTGVTAGMNNYQYRCNVTNCAALIATSNAAMLTVNAATLITSQPTNSTLCVGTSTSFVVAATGTSLSYQWQVSTDGGNTFNNLSNVAPYSNVTTTTLNITATPAGLNGYQYRCVVSSTCSPLNSSVATLTVNSAPAITGQPANSSVCAGNAATFTVTATGGGLTYQWQESTNGGGTWNNLTNVAPYSGVLTATLVITPTATVMNNYQYRCVVTGSCPSPATSNAAILSVGTALSITSQPINSTVCAGATTSFTVAISGTVISYQWQESTNGGGTWNNITNGGVYNGATTVMLTLTGVLATMNAYQYRCVVTGSCPAINSNAATLTVNTAPNITSQPASSTICAPQNTSFAVTATGTGITYQWQVSTAGCTGPWTDITNAGVYAGATLATLTITGAPAIMNGYGYRCNITGTCTPVATSSCVSLTVNTAVAISAQPSNSITCAGSNAIFSVTATGTSPTYQWQESTNGGGTWNSMINGGVYSGASTATLTLTGVTVGMNTYQYRCIVTGAAPCGIVNSTGASLTVNTAPAITAQPVAGTTICAGQNTSYTVIANGTALTYQWQVSTDGGGTYSNLANGAVYIGVTSSALTITAATVGMNTYRYRCVISGTCIPSVNSSAAILTVYVPISITTAPVNATICATGTTSFSVVAAGSSPTYQWQESTNGGTTWSNISNGGIYSGTTTTTLTLTGVTPGMNGYLYRTIVTGTAPCGAVNTIAATLTVSAQPTVILSAFPYTKLYPGYSTVITASVTPATGFTTVWTRNGNPISISGNSKTVTVNELGIYTVVATIGSCISLPATITIGDSASSKLWIFPSPNNGQFTISYYNPGGGATTQNVTIYDSKGAKVYNNNFPVTQAYQLLPIDMRRNSAGVYYVVLRLADGSKVKTGRVVIR